MTQKKTIYIHIGTPKTGTTSIQNYLASNSDLLSKKGCLVPASSRRYLANHTLLANYCINKTTITEVSIRNGIYTERQLRVFRKKFKNKLSAEIRNFTGSKIIFSSEQCYENLKTQDEIQKLKDLFSDLNVDIKIIVYIREQADMLCSLYSTRMRGGKTFEMPDINEFAGNDVFNYNERLKLWEKVFGIENIILRIFDRSKMIDNDIVSDFTMALGLEKVGFVPQYLNEKLNAAQCEFLRLINEYIPYYRKNRINVIRNGLVDMVEGIKPDSPELSVLINKDYQTVYEQENVKLFQRYFGFEKDLFDKKKLSDKSLSQCEILSEDEKRTMASEIIDKYRNSNEVLCKCIAAIFNVKYNDELISREFIESLDMNKVSRYQRGGFRRVLKKIRKKLVSIIKKVYKR